MIRKIVTTVFFAAGVCAVLAGPRLSVDKTTFNTTVTHNVDTVVQAEFRYTNTGNAPLKISDVRVSCGCTVVSYDTVIAPGKTGVIKPKVNIKGTRPGNWTRTVTILSNAENTPSQVLTISYAIVSPIEVSESHLHISGTEKKVLYLSSLKNDLAVSGVVFKPRQGEGGGMGKQNWASNVSMVMNYKFAPTDSTRADGFKVYRLELDPMPSSSPVAGEITITTNHPEKREVILNAD